MEYWPIIGNTLHRGRYLDNFNNMPTNLVIFRATTSTWFLKVRCWSKIILKNLILLVSCIVSDQSLILIKSSGFLYEIIYIVLSALIQIWFDVSQLLTLLSSWLRVNVNYRAFSSATSQQWCIKSYILTWRSSKCTFVLAHGLELKLYLEIFLYWLCFHYCVNYFQSTMLYFFPLQLIINKINETKNSYSINLSISLMFPACWGFDTSDWNATFCSVLATDGENLAGSFMTRLSLRGALVSTSANFSESDDLQQSEHCL